MPKTTNLLLLLITCISFPIFAQDLAPCGTPIGKSPWLKAFQQRPQLYFKQQDTLLYIPITIHSVADDDGSGHFGTANLLDALCTLNADFAAANIQFYLAGEIQLINKSDFNEHETVVEGGQYMQQYDIANTVNTYFMRNGAGNCGYNLPWASIAVSKVCAVQNKTTWAHEVGHHFTLPHTFLGWEGGVTYDGSIPLDYDSPAPEFVLYNYTNFKETLLQDTLIIDTALVEKVDGSNCHIAADGFCDTPPDYLSLRWNCNRTGISDTRQTDPNNDKFRSDGSYIMSYANPGCTSQFSSEQIAAMRAYILEERADLLMEEPPANLPITEQTNLIAPINEEAVAINTIELNWQPVENATQYIVDVSTRASFPSGLTNTYETDQTSVFPTGLRLNRTYNWRVRPYNFSATCANYSEVETFKVVEETTAVLSVDGIQSMTIYPSLLESGTPLILSLEMTQSISGQVSVIDLNGKELYKQAITYPTGIHELSISTKGFAAGLYLVGLETQKGQIFNKIIVQK